MFHKQCLIIWPWSNLVPFDKNDSQKNAKDYKNEQDSSTS